MAVPPRRDDPVVRKAGPGRKPRVAYKVVVELFPHEWDELRMEAGTRGITGGELIGALLSQYIASSTPPPTVDGDEGGEQDG